MYILLCQGDNKYIFIRDIDHQNMKCVHTKEPRLLIRN